MLSLLASSLSSATPSIRAGFAGADVKIGRVIYILKSSINKMSQNIKRDPQEKWSLQTLSHFTRPHLSTIKPRGLHDNSHHQQILVQAKGASDLRRISALIGGSQHVESE
jgi:hypothetical protein